MCSQVSAFNGNLSKWNVGKFMCVRNMFSDSKYFNQDLSKSNVTQVVDMGDMFSGSTSFKKVLCGETWINLKSVMFKDSPRYISSVCFSR